MTASPAPMRLTSVLACPSCGHQFTGRWTEGRETAPQHCEACGHEFEATWPGFRCEPVTVIVRPGQEPASDAA